MAAVFRFDGANLVTLLFCMALTGSLYLLPFLMMQGAVPPDEQVAA